MAGTRNLVLTVCTGNVCRSPMAQALLRHALDAENEKLDELSVVSAGVAAAPGYPASENSVIALKRVGINLSGHKSRMLTPDLVGRAFAIFGMTQSHLDIIRSSYDQLPDRIHLFRDFIGNGEHKEIPDPFGEGIESYRATLDAMIEAVPSLVTYLKSEYNS